MERIFGLAVPCLRRNLFVSSNADIAFNPRSVGGISNKDGFRGAVRQQNCSAVVLDDHIPY